MKSISKISCSVYLSGKPYCCQRSYCRWKYTAYPGFSLTELEIDCFIADYLLVQQFPEIIKTYHLEPFQAYAQDIGRTFIDKVFAICDYYIENNPTEHSRHLYDLSMIIDRLGSLESLIPLIAEVRTERHNNPSCHSANKDLNGILTQIMDENFYQKDYEKITSQLLYDPVAYDDVILA